MGLTGSQKLELNKRVDKILHAPANAPAGGQQPEIAFVADLSGSREWICDSIKDAAASLRSHDKVFQNVRCNMVYWDGRSACSKVLPMPFIQLGRAFDDLDVENTMQTVDNALHMEGLCGYLKMYHARCRCILLFTDCTYEQSVRLGFLAADPRSAIENLNPFLRYRILIMTKDRAVTGSELMMKWIDME